MEHSRLKDEISSVWANDVVPTLVEYIAIPALSPSFDTAWEAHGSLTHAVGLLSDWARRLGLAGVTVAVRELVGRTPVIVVRARFHGEPGDRATAVRRIKDLANERMAKQPLAQPNTGSIFRNPAGDHAGRLIEAAGLKGARIGDAVVSEKHANFIVNAGAASAADVLALIRRCQAEVKEQFGVDLVPEVEMVGEWDE